MKKVVLDTNVLIDYANGYATWIDEVLTRLRDFTRLILPTIVLAEYFTSEEFEKKEKIEIADRTFMEFDKQDLTEDIAKILGTILRRKTYSHGVSLADLIIAATAIHLDAELATRNRSDFVKIPHLHFFDPTSLKKLDARDNPLLKMAGFAKSTTKKLSENVDDIYFRD